MAKAKAQQKVTIAAFARSLTLSKKGDGYISRDQLDKEEAEVAMATALIQVANETIEVNKAEHKIAEQIVSEHEITTPIGGIITEILKRPGERVGANEAVLRIVNLDRLRFIGYVPIETAIRLNIGDVIQVRPTVEGADLDIEKMTFPAKITFVAPEAQVVGKAEVQIHATLKNPRRDGGETGPYLLRAGLKADATIPPGGAAPANAVGQR
ncbi:MAG: HlyD family efflux transporter periplasmic adaptor subunit [Isosphaeraceae bacterium]